MSDKIEKWAKFHLYLPAHVSDRASDEDVSRIHQVVWKYGGELLYQEDIESTHDDLK